MLIRAGWAILLAVATSTPAAAKSPATSPTVGDKAPSLRGAVTAAGEAWASSLDGQVVIVTFGASWCAPCKKELPALDAAAGADLAPRKGKKPVRILAVNIDDELEVGKAFMASVETKSLTALFDPKGRVASRYRPAAMPTTYVIDAKGVVRHIHKGYKAGDERLLVREAAKLR